MEKEPLGISEDAALRSFLLGLAHGGIAEILKTDESTWYIKLLELHKRLSQGIEMLYYGRPNPHQDDTPQ